MPTCFSIVATISAVLLKSCRRVQTRTRRFKHTAHELGMVSNAKCPVRTDMYHMSRVRVTVRVSVRVRVRV